MNTFFLPRHIYRRDIGTNLVHKFPIGHAPCGLLEIGDTFMIIEVLDDGAQDPRVHILGCNKELEGWCNMATDFCSEVVPDNDNQDI